MPYSIDNTHIVIDATDNGKTYALAPLVYAVLNTPMTDGFKVSFIKTSSKTSYITSALGITGVDNSVNVVTRFDLPERNSSVDLMFDTLNNRWQIVSKSLGDISIKAA